MTLHQFLNSNYLYSNIHAYTDKNIDVNVNINEISIKNCVIIAKLSNKSLEYVLNLIIKHL